MTFALQYGGGFGGTMQNLFYQLQNWGVFDVLVPFILIFTLLFAVLDKVQVFKVKKYNVVIAMMISLIVIVPHVTGIYSDSFDLVNIINSALPQVALILIAVVLFMVMVGMLWKGEQGETFGIKGVAVPIAATLILLFIFGSAAYPQYKPSWLAWLGDPSLQMLVIIILIFGLIVYFVTGGKEETAEERTARETAAAVAAATAAARGHH
jgi:hypothetical protein